MLTGINPATGEPLGLRRWGRSHRLRRYDLSMTKAELIEQVKAMTEEEAAEVKLIYAPDWPSKATSIEEIRRRVGTRAMTPDESEKFWQEYGPLMQPPDGEG
jgi:hypothetical protein